MLNETEWNDNVHAFPKTSARDIARDRREADQIPRLSPLPAIMGSLLVWCGIAAVIYFLI